MSQEIRLTFHFASPVPKILKALTEEAHLRKWWTQEASVVSGKGIFPFKGHGWTLELEITAKNNLVTWKCLQSNMQNTNAWEGTTISFKLLPDGSGTGIEFLHSDYKDKKSFETVSQNWKEFIGTSLRSYVETGEGHPYKSKS
jgi:hypothetical protein